MTLQECPMCGQIRECTHPHWANPENKHTYLCDTCYSAEVKSGCYDTLKKVNVEPEVITVTRRGRKKKVKIDRGLTNLGGFIK